MIVNCLKTADEANVGEDPSARTRATSSNILRDPHASLSLFAPREETEQQHLASIVSPRGGARPRQRDAVEILGDESEQHQLASVISPRGGARPRQRDLAEILGDEHVDVPSSPSAGRDRSESPSKAIAPKIGAGKNYQPSRLFETEEGEEPNSPEANSSKSFYRPNASKYNHFDFADGSESQDASAPGEPSFQKTKHSSQWSFDDFATPRKAVPTRALQKSHQDIRHWGNEDDEVQDSPVRKPVAPKPRRDAEPHFDFVDDGESEDEPRALRPRGATQNPGLGLYKNNLYSEQGDEEAAGPDNQALGNITNLKDRNKTFAAQFQMTDASPAPKQPVPPVGDDRKKAVKMMESSWDTYDSSPAQKENQPAQDKATTTKSGEGDRGIHISGDGMGGSSGTNRDWLFGGEEESQRAKAAPGRKQGGAGRSAAGGFNWDF
jgi:hypothetical protein